MSELNHEIDRDNLNKAYDATAKDMATLLFPNGRKRYVEELDEKINAFGCVAPGTKVNVPYITFWNSRTGMVQSDEITDFYKKDAD